jgi:DNA-binding transcriptional LysR family regulator
VVDLDTLASLDGLLWLQTGEEVARRFGLSQSTVSRNARRCIELFGLNLKKREGEWDLSPGHPILAAERRVHQLARWQQRRPLRLEGTYWSGPLLASPAPAGWIVGRNNIIGIARNLDLVRQGIVDAWIAGRPDLPATDDPDLISLPLSQMPVHCVVQAGHPLLRQEQLSFDDLAAYPSLALLPGAYPQAEAALRRVGLWNTPVRMLRYDRNRWEGKTETELTIGYATALSLEVTGGDLFKLPLELPLISGDALVLQRQFAASEPAQQLRRTLLERLRPWADRHPEIQLLEPTDAI